MRNKRIYLVSALAALVLLTLACELPSCAASAVDLATGEGTEGETGVEPAGGAAETLADGLAEPPATSPPNPPSGLSAALVEIYDVRVGWQDNSPDEDGFVVTHVREDQPEPPRRVAVAGRDVTADLDQYTMCGATYRYIVASFNEAGESPTEECWVISIPECPLIREVTLQENEDFDFFNAQRNPAAGGDFGVQMVDGGAALVTGGNPNGGISNAGRLPDVPLFEVNLQAAGAFVSGSVPAVPGNTYVAMARRAGEYVVFRVNSAEQASPLEVSLNWFYYDATGRIEAEPCDAAGVTPRTSCPDGLCDVGESVEDCPEDCDSGCVLGDGLMNPGETCDGDGDCPRGETCSPLTCNCGRLVDECLDRLPPGALLGELEGGLRVEADGDGGMGGGGGPIIGDPCITDADCPPGEICDPELCICHGESCEDWVPPGLRGVVVWTNFGPDWPWSGNASAGIACWEDGDCPPGTTCDPDLCECQLEVNCREVFAASPLLGTWIPGPDITLCVEDGDCPTVQTCADDACYCECPPATDGCTFNAECSGGYLCRDCNCGYCGDGSWTPTAGEECDLSAGKDCALGETCVDCRCVSECALNDGVTNPGEECDTDADCPDDEICTLPTCSCIPRGCPPGSHGCLSDAECQERFGPDAWCDENCNCRQETELCPPDSDGCIDDAFCQSLLGDPSALCEVARCHCYVPGECPPNSFGCGSDEVCQEYFGPDAWCDEDCNCRQDTQVCPLNSHECTSDAQCREMLANPNALCELARCHCYIPDTGCPPGTPCGGLGTGYPCTTASGAAGTCQNCECLPTGGGCPQGAGNCCGDGICQSDEDGCWCGDCPDPGDCPEPEPEPEPEEPPQVCPAGTPCAGLPNGSSCTLPNALAVINGTCVDCQCVRSR